MLKKSLLAFAVAAALGLAAHSASAATVFVGTSGTHSAEADFSYDGSQFLTVTLINTATTAASSNPDLLNAVFWHYTSSTIGFLDSVTGGTRLWTNTTGTPTIDQEDYFGYANNVQPVSGILTNQQYGVSSSSLSMSGYGDPFGASSGIHLTGGSAGTGNPDGPAGGLISNAGVSGFSNTVAVIKNSVTYKINVGAGFDESAISNIVFAYGTSISTDPTFGGGGGSGNSAPLPAGAVGGMSLMGALGLGAGIRRKLRRA